MIRLIAALFLVLSGCVASIETTVVPDPGCELDYCTYEGWCTDIGRECIATTQAECDQSQICLEQGCCTLSSGNCVCK